ncbi:MAG: S-adenosylmethionine decarboxylase [Selenomonadaceae bacterium]|nr:S-adenosylmethionine decarboxylase [Selenomonadaceae bacterium]
MKILARQLTLDMYNCERLKDIEGIKNTLRGVVGYEPDLYAENIDENHCAVIGAFSEGHIALHVYSELKYVAADIFTCTDSEEPEEIAKAIRKYFKPDKIKSTFLKRGDFGLDKEIKPKIKVRVAPLRRVRNKVVGVISEGLRNNK